MTHEIAVTFVADHDAVKAGLAGQRTVFVHVDAPDDVTAQLVAAQISIAQGRFVIATTLVL